jgi:hypothetical protein
LPKETEVAALEQLQLEEDARLFGTRIETSLRDSDEVNLEAMSTRRLAAEFRRSTAVVGPERSGTSLSPNIDLLTAANNISEREASSDRTSAPSQAPIYAWLANTELPEDPDSVIKWREASEAHRTSCQEQDASDLEIFKNVELSLPLSDDVPKRDKLDTSRASHAETEAGPYLLLRNILDRYPSLGEPVAWRFAQGNWNRMKVLQESERTAPMPSTAPIRPHSPPGLKTITKAAFDNCLATANDYVTLDEGEFPSNLLNESVPSDDDGEEKFTLGYTLQTSNPLKARKVCWLPPPPRLVRGCRLGYSYSANCHICHQTIHLNYKRDWR